MEARQIKCAQINTQHLIKEPHFPYFHNAVDFIENRLTEWLEFERENPTCVWLTQADCIRDLPKQYNPNIVSQPLD